MIYVFKPYAPLKDHKNLGKTYNEYMGLLPYDDDYAILCDHDMMFTTYQWYKQIEDIIQKHGDDPQIGMFVPRTNRLWYDYQKPLDLKSKTILEFSNDVSVHRIFGKKMEEENYLKITKYPSNGKAAGIVLVIKKSIWKKIGFNDGLLGVDFSFHDKIRNLNKEVYIMEGVYVYRWYRGGNITNYGHLL